jgi:transcriptional regulator with XRE-family HTH domain
MTQPLLTGLGRRIAHYRKLNGWSARQLADNTDGVLTRATIANIESGRRDDIHLSQFLAICLALRVPPHALLVDLERPLDPASMRFPGPAPAPLSDDAPSAAFLGWLRGHTRTTTTAAARRVDHLTGLIEDYLAALDADEIADARSRLGAPQDKTESARSSRTDEARMHLTRAGVQIGE